MLADGNLTFATAHDHARIKDPKIRKLRRRIETIGDASLTDPLMSWRCIMEMTLKDGRKLTHQTMAAKGGSRQSGYASRGGNKVARFDGACTRQETQSNTDVNALQYREHQKRTRVAQTIRSLSKIVRGCPLIRRDSLVRNHTKSESLINFRLSPYIKGGYG